MEALKRYIKERIVDGIKRCKELEQDEIYAYSLFVYDEDDDPRYPTIQLGYNTIDHYQSEIRNASSEAEAKWNFAFWLQNEVATVGRHNDCSEDQRMITSWIVGQDLYYTDDEEDEDFDLCLDKGAEITVNFVNLLIDVVQQIHEEYSLEVPILIHELEYYDQIRLQNIQANGTERVREFSNWIASF